MPYATQSHPRGGGRFPLLSTVDLPADLRRLSPEELPSLAMELRGFLVDSVSQTGGHLAAGLGVVELTIALHYVFDTPRRPAGLGRGPSGLSPQDPHRAGASAWRPCARRAASPAFPSAARANTTPSASATPAPPSAPPWAWRWPPGQRGERRHVVAIIGDGALGAGMAFEALNHAGSTGHRPDGHPQRQRDVHLAAGGGHQQSPGAAAVRQALHHACARAARRALQGMPQLRQLVGRWEEHMKGMVMPSTLFEELGFNYIGPIDGHDIDGLVAHPAQHARTMPGPRLLHIVTQKGRGYEPAEGQPVDLPRRDALRPRHRRAAQGQGQGAAPTPRSSATGCATPPTRTRAWSASPRPCARARA